MYTFYSQRKFHWNCIFRVNTILRPFTAKCNNKTMYMSFEFNVAAKCGDILLKLTLVKQNYVYILCTFWGFFCRLFSLSLINVILLDFDYFHFLFNTHHLRAIAFVASKHYGNWNSLEFTFFCMPNYWWIFIELNQKKRRSQRNEDKKKIVSLLSSIDMCVCMRCQLRGGQHPTHLILPLKIN